MTARVVLAQQASFALGPLQIRPSICSVARGDREEVLEPRVMQVLVMLAGAEGTVVSRDALIAACWEGRVVGDDAINRVLSRLRRLGEGLGAGAFSIQTITRVGYRLVTPMESGLDSQPSSAPVPQPSNENEPQALEQQATLPAAAARPAFRAWGAALAGAVLLAIVSIPIWRSAPAAAHVRVLALQSTGTGASSTLAQTLRGDIVDVLTKSGFQADSGERSWLPEWLSGAGMTLGGSVVQTGRQLEVHLSLNDAGSGVTLWSGRFERDAAAASRLANEASVAVAETVYRAHEVNRQKSLKLDPETAALEMRGMELLENPRIREEDTPREILEQAIARAPRSAFAYGILAVASAAGARLNPGVTEEASFAAIRGEAQKAIAIDASVAGAAYDAMYIGTRAQHPRQIVQAEDWVLQGLRHDPDFPFLHMRECRTLTEVGRAREAEVECQHALGLRPFTGPIGWSYAHALSVTGADGWATEAIDAAARYNPDHIATRRTRFELAAFGGRPDLAIALLRNPETRPLGMKQTQLALWERFLTAQGSGSPSQRDGIAGEIFAAASRGDLDLDFAVMALTMFGHVDDAYGLLHAIDLGPFMQNWGTSFLFEPWTAPLRRDPRFWTLAANLGIAQHWSARGKWPDMCGSEIALATCKTETAKALRALGGRTPG